MPSTRTQRSPRRASTESPPKAPPKAPMDTEGFNAFCATLPHAHHVVQWGGAHVWKVAGKVFAIGGWNEGDGLSVSFKCSAIAFEVLKEQAGLRPAPYLASRGMMWIQRTTPQSMGDQSLCAHICESHRLVSLDLPKKLQRELGLNQHAEAASSSPTNATGRTDKKPEAPK